MSKRWVNWIRQHQIAILVAGVLVVIGVLAAAVAAVSLWNPPAGGRQGVTTPVLVDTPDPGGGGAQVQAGVVASGDAAESGGDDLRILLSEGQVALQEVAYGPVARGEPLSHEEVEQILARLPSLEAEDEDRVDFNLPEDSLPPPRTGETIEEPFPPPPPAVTPEVVEASPLEVLRYAPEGEIPLPPFVNVTFNQPMVPLATLDALSAEEVPVQLEPALPGTWKWLGTKTLSFEYDSEAIDRLPMATQYVVSVPAGTESATGRVLAETVRRTFSTPPPQMTAYTASSSPQPLAPLFTVSFDQRIDPEAVLETLEVAPDGRAVPVRLATSDEVEADKGARRLADRAAEGR